MDIAFSKYHGLGNDFIIVDARGLALDLSAKTIAALSDRRTGIGCDQFVIIRDDAKADAFIDLYNATGHLVEACGNATRCVAAHLGQPAQTSINLRSVMGILHCEFVGEDTINVHMGKARIQARNIPLSQDYSGHDLPVQTDVPGAMAKIAVNMGNPHCVVLLDHVIADDDLRTKGAALEKDPLFPKRANIEFLTRDGDDDTSLRMRVWERGVGVTQACGSGACASIVAAKLYGWVDDHATIRLDGGDLNMRVDNNLHVQMQGSFAKVFTGHITVEQAADA
ncbi:MAG: diaminopimelate epimerase [Pseudomonadota bacterium]